MDDGRERREVDVWVRKTLTPDGAASARVAARALAISRASTAASRRGPFAVLAATLALLAIFVGFQWRHDGPAPASPAAPIPNGGPLVVIESADGRRWIFGGSPERPIGGSYMVVIPGSEEVK